MGFQPMSGMSSLLMKFINHGRDARATLCGERNIISSLLVRFGRQ